MAIPTYRASAAHNLSTRHESLSSTWSYIYSMSFHCHGTVVVADDGSPDECRHADQLIKLLLAAVSTFWYESAYIGNGMMGAMLTVENQTCGCPMVCDPTCRCPNEDDGRACIASYCNQSSCPIADPHDPTGPVLKNGSHGHFICPVSMPLCSGYEYGKQFGNCVGGKPNASVRCPLPPGVGPGAPGTAKLRLDINRVDGASHCCVHSVVRPPPSSASSTPPFSVDLCCPQRCFFVDDCFFLQRGH